MNHAEKQGYLYRLISGNLIFELNDIEYVVKTPELSLLQKAQRLFDKIVYEESFNEGLLYTYEIRAILLRNELISLDQEKRIEKIQESIDDTKVDMYLNVLNSKEVARLRSKLAAQNTESNKLFYNLHMLDYLTAEGYANMIRAQYIYCNTIYYLEDERLVFDNDVDYQLLDALMYEIQGQVFDYNKLREIARTEPWRSYWNLQKENLFGKPVIHLNEEQRTVAAYSKMYDSIFENSNCPPDNVIEDNDLLDGWMISQRRENEKNRKEEELEKLLGDNMKEHKEIFLPTKRAGEVEGFTREEIDSFNDPVTRKIKAQRENIIVNKGQASDSELPGIN